MTGGFRRGDQPGPVTPVSDRFERWVAPRWIMVQLAVLGAVGAPWILVALFGLRWGWLTLGGSASVRSSVFWGGGGERPDRVGRC